MKTLAMAVALALSSACLAHAEVRLARATLGYSYFNRPGADLQSHDAELAACLVQTSRMRSGDETGGTAQTPGVAGAIIGGLITNASHKGVVAAGVENCMVVRGWRVVLLPDAEGAKLATMSPDALHAVLEPWVGAGEPHGQIVRVWTNDAIRASTSRYELRPPHTDGGQLGISALAAARLPPPDVADLGPVAIVLDKKRIARTLTPNEFSSVPPGHALIIVHLKGVGPRNGVAITFEREGPDRSASAWARDGQPDVLWVFIYGLFADKNGKFFAFDAPPGRWRLGSMHSINLCLGSPAFDAAAGDTVYAGAFDLGSEDFGPDLSLDAPHGFLGSSPATRQLRAAVYNNGSVGICSGPEIYAVEFKGAPFEHGYSWGSLAGTAAH